MGLDSVELILEIEQYFDIRIPDIQAEQTGTVRQLVDIICLHRQINPAVYTLRDQQFSKLQHYLAVAVPGSAPLTLNSRIALFLPTGDHEGWQSMQEALALEIPKPALFTSPVNRIKIRIKKWFESPPSYIWQSVTVEQFIDALCARNHKSLVNPRGLLSRYDIYIGVMAVLAEKIGLDYYEITPEKSFTDDFGID